MEYQSHSISPVFHHTGLVEVACPRYIVHVQHIIELQ